MLVTMKAKRFLEYPHAEQVTLNIRNDQELWKYMLHSYVDGLTSLYEGKCILIYAGTTPPNTQEQLQHPAIIIRRTEEKMIEVFERVEGRLDYSLDLVDRNFIFYNAHLLATMYAVEKDEVFLTKIKFSGTHYEQEDEFVHMCYNQLQKNKSDEKYKVAAECIIFGYTPAMTLDSARRHKISQDAFVIREAVRLLRERNEKSIIKIKEK